MKDAFVTQFVPNGQLLEYSTYLGGEGADIGHGIAVDGAGRAHLAGWTTSTDFPVDNAYQWLYRGGTSITFPSDGYVTCLSSSGSTLEYSTFLGGSDNDRGMGIALDGSSRDCVTGRTDSVSFPVSHPYQSFNAGGRDAFMSRFSFADRGHTDFNGDGISDIAIFRESSGLWAIRGISRVYFGGTGDLPVPDDYNGDGTTAIGIFRESSGLWAVRGITRLYFGSSGDRPIPRDYDGDSYCDAGIFRPVSGLWALRGVTRLYFGGSGDLPVTR